jgi:hypothetical protein
MKKNYDSNNGFKNLYCIVILNVYKLLLYGSSATDKYFCALWKLVTLISGYL